MDTLEKIFSTVNDWLRFAEAKNAILVGASGVAFWAVVRVAQASTCVTVIEIYLVQLGFFLLLAILAGIISFLPATNNRLLAPTLKESEADNLLYFGHLARYQPGTLLRALKAHGVLNGGDNEALSLMYANQIIVNSRITTAKLKMFIWGFRFIFFGILTPVLGIPALLLVEHTRKAVNGY